MAGCARILPLGGVLYLYGPFWRADHAPEPSNLAFDSDLKSRNSAWGLRNVEDIAAAAKTKGLSLDRIIEMPANNLSLLFKPAT